METTVTERPTLFLRKASGVVRAFSPLDAWIYNVLAPGVIALLAMSYVLAHFVYPGGNLAVAILLTGVLCSFQNIVYAMLVAAMPRSGGDYLFQSRLLSGAVAFTVTFSFYILIMGMWLAIFGWWLSAMILAPFMTMLGAFWGSQFLTDAAAWVGTPTGIFLMGVLISAGCVFIGGIGLKAYAAVQRWFFWIGLAAIAIMIGWIAVFDRNSFVTSFNGFMSQNFGTADAYQKTIADAQAAGFAPDLSFSFGQTLAVIPITFFALMYCIWGSGLAGEIRDTGGVKSRLWQMLGALWFCTGLGALIAYLITSRFGTEFLASASWLYYNAPDSTPLPVPPFYGFFVAALSTNPALTLIVFVAFIAWFWVTIPNIIGGSRMLLAAAMDRVAPAWAGKVNSRTHTPLNALLLMGAFGVVFSALYGYTEFFWKLTLSVSLIAAVSFGITAMAAAIWPYVKSEQFNASPAGRYRIGRVPVITICGVLYAIGTLYVLWAYVTVPDLGMSSALALAFNAGMFILGAIIYFAFKAYRKSRESLDISMAYREIPPE